MNYAKMMAASKTARAEAEMRAMKLEHLLRALATNYAALHAGDASSLTLRALKRDAREAIRELAQDWL